MALQSKRVILASGSPRRKDILADMGVEFVVVPSNVDEDKIHSPFAQILVKNSLEPKPATSSSRTNKTWWWRQIPLSSRAQES